MDIVIVNKQNEFVDAWPDWTGVVPAEGDAITFYVGDHHEIPMTRVVWGRAISGDNPDKVTLIVDTN